MSRITPIDDLSQLIEEQVNLILGPLPEPCRCVEPLLGKQDHLRFLIQCKDCGDWLTLEYLRGGGPRHEVK